MLLKTIKWLLLVAIVLLLGLIAVFHFKARSALDQEYTHSRETGALPVFSAKTTDGLVRVAANGYEFRVRVAGFGPKANGREKPAVVLLHGFPVTSAMWNALIDPLQEAGYRVLALDQRGYSPGARPSEVGDYTTLKLREGRRHRLAVQVHETGLGVGGLANQENRPKGEHQSPPLRSKPRGSTRRHWPPPPPSKVGVPAINCGAQHSGHPTS